MQARMLYSAFIILIMICAYLGIVDFLSAKLGLNAYDTKAISYLSDVRERATYTYALARTLNGLISLLESIEIGIPFISAQPAQILEPLNDLIEQFSDLILISLASIGIQEILLRLFQDVSWRYFLPLALFPLLISLWLPTQRQKWQSLAFGLVIFCILSRLFLPIISFTAQGITQHYLLKDYNAAVTKIEEANKKTSQQIDARNKAVLFLDQPSDTSHAESITAPSPLELEDLGHLKDIISAKDFWQDIHTIPDRIITLLTIFTFETLVWPLVVFFMFFLGTTFFLRHLKKQETSSKI